MMPSLSLFSLAAYLVMAWTMAAGRQLLKMNKCQVVSTIYEPSALERAWSGNFIKTKASSFSKSSDAFCTELNKNISEIRRISSLVSHLMKSVALDHSSRRQLATQVPLSHDQRTLLSHFHHKMDCGSLGERTTTTSIEPLIGSLRHPRFPCVAEDTTVDKSYMLLASSLDPLYRGDSNSEDSRPKVIIFDLGASTYNSGGGGSSQDWFVDTLKTRGFDVDEYYGWEMEEMTDSYILDPVPKQLLAHYHYFNIPAPTGVDDLGNPLNMLKAVSKPSDYVILKLDIDNSVVELEFVEQLLAQSELHALVDEFFFEHHVNFDPMNGAWSTENETMTLFDSYEIFGKLRRVGIRAHGWV